MFLYRKICYLLFNLLMLVKGVRLVRLGIVKLIVQYCREGF